MSEGNDDRLVRLCGCPDCGSFASAAFMELKHQQEVAAALERLLDCLVRAFVGNAWPRRVTVPAPRSAAAREALDQFVTALRQDLPDITVVVDPAL